MHHHSSWSIDLTLVLLIAVVFYSRAWRVTKRDVRRFVAFHSGLLVLWISVATPLAHLDHEELTAHMMQHLLIMTVAAPLLLWGVRKMLPVRIGVHPVVCWLAGSGVVIWWHIPAIFELGMSSAAWHGIEQATFLLAGLLFWLPVMEPWSGEQTDGQFLCTCSWLPCRAMRCRLFSRFADTWFTAHIWLSRDFPRRRSSIRLARER